MKSVNQIGAAIALTAFLLIPAATMSAVAAERTQLAQRGGDNVTPLRFLTREQLACQDACRTRTSQCHARVQSGRSKEGCEHIGMRCVENCTR